VATSISALKPMVNISAISFWKGLRYRFLMVRWRSENKSKAFRVDQLMSSERIELIQGDITKMEVDAVVNAANTSLLGGGGVDGAIHRAGGRAILEECIKIRDKQGGCKVGEAVITTAGNMPSKYVIHTVGPVWSQSKSGADELLANAYH